MSKGKPLGNCKTCGSEIVATANEGNFGEGECGACEYQRYMSQPELLAVSRQAYSVLCDLSYHGCFRGKSKRCREVNDLIGRIGAALNAYGNDS